MISNIFPPGASTVPQLRLAAKAWATANKDISSKRAEQIISAFIRDPSPMKKCMGGILLGYIPAQRHTLPPSLYDKWLEHTEGWAAIDAICYGNFTAKEILEKFAGWKVLIKRLAGSKNINKRRAAIVLLTKPVTQSDDKRLSQLAFGVIDALKSEKSILITKAISWLLRNLTKLHPEEVKEYLHSQKDQLPKIAIRETVNKLKHGVKTGR
jgi:3-methyladenine DNA glycosylase AlkD